MRKICAITAASTSRSQSSRFATSPTTFVFSFTSLPGASFYNVYLSEFEDFKKMTELDPTVERITESQLVIAGLQPQVNYTFAVTAINEEGLESDPSSKITLETCERMSMFILVACSAFLSY